ncbi:MAG: phosphotransferase [Micropepsaceae bacterium]
MTNDPQALRQEQARQFIARSGWSDAEVQTLPGDASSRRYWRLVRGSTSLILMDQPRGAESAACPPDASDAERLRLGYNAVARLAGPDCRPFAAVAGYLRQKGLSAPEIVAHDFDTGFLLIEDLGHGRFADLILAGQEERPFYEAAIDALAHLHRHAAPTTLSIPDGGEKHLLAYDALAMEAEVRLLIDWFFPAASGNKISQDAEAEFTQVWHEALSRFRVELPVIVLRDYHAENLMWLPDRAGIAKVGQLDFQDALSGSPAYDLISLTEDARREVGVELAEAMTARYVGLRKSDDRQFDETSFRFAAALLATQRNTKIVGIFARLWKRDGKPRYTQYLPRMWRYLERDLSHGALGDLKAWFDKHIPQTYRGTLGN